MRYGYVEIALAFALVWTAAKLAERFVNAVASIFQVDGGRSDAPCQRVKALHTADTGASSLPGSTSARVGGPFAVDASNGPSNVEGLTPEEYADIRRLGGMVEIHHCPEGIAPPPSRRPRIIH